MNEGSKVTVRSLKSMTRSHKWWRPPRWWMSQAHCSIHTPETAIRHFESSKKHWAKMSSSHNCIRSSVNICQSFSDWFLQHPDPEKLHEWIRNTRQGFLPLLRPVGWWDGIELVCLFWVLDQLRIKTKSRAAGEQMSQWLYWHWSMRLANTESQNCQVFLPGTVQVVLGPAEGPFSFPIGRDQTQMYAPCK